MATTIKDLSALSNLSIGTISKYLNGEPIREKNRLVLERVIKETNYSINEIAKGLKTSRTMSVGILIPKLADVFFSNIVSIIEKRLGEFGYSVFLCDYDGDEEMSIKKLQFLMAKKVDGIIAAPGDASGEYLSKISEDVPVVLYDYLVKGLQSDAVLTDNFSASYEAVEQLIKRGHKRIGIIAGKQGDSWTSNERLHGYNNAHRSYGLDIDDNLIKYGWYTTEGGYAACNEFLDMENPPTVIFATNYYMSTGAYFAIHNRKMSIPDDISLLAFDNIEILKFIQPVLSTVIQPIEEMAAKTADILVKRMKGDKTGFPEVCRLRPEVMITDSVKNLSGI